MWRQKIFIRYMPIVLLIAKRYKAIAAKDGHVVANRWLGTLSFELKLGRTGMSLTCSDEELWDYCKKKAQNLQNEIYELVGSVGKKLAPEIIRKRFNHIGIKFPLAEKYDEEELLAALARICDPKFLKSQLRVKRGRDLEHFIRRNGCINKTNQIYVSDITLQRRLKQKTANRKLLESLEAVNEDGQVYSMDQLADISPANPIIRRNELMVRSRGFEEFAKASEAPMTGMFYTFTCPSRFHVCHVTGKQNSKYDDSSPLKAHGYSNTVWKKVRSAWARAGIRPFGIRVVEPHHDGTPHWHLLLFFKTEQVQQANSIFRYYAMQEDGDEPGAEKHRFTAVEIDPTKGSATGYIAKYISKNIDGAHVDADHYGKDAVESSVRIEAWASNWGIRQFQQIGGASITVYRELRRLKGEGVALGLLRDLTNAADTGDWAEYCSLMGGMNCPRKDRPLRPYMIERKEENRYGEMVKVLRGIWHGPIVVITRIHEWIVRPRKEDDENVNGAGDGVGFGAAESNAPPGACSPLEYCQ